MDAGANACGPGIVAGRASTVGGDGSGGDNGSNAYEDREDARRTAGEDVDGAGEDGVGRGGREAKKGRCCLQERSPDPTKRLSLTSYLSPSGGRVDGGNLLAPLLTLLDCAGLHSSLHRHFLIFTARSASLQTTPNVYSFDAENRGQFTRLNEYASIAFKLNSTIA